MKAILFDLDSTLLPMDEEKFTNYYFNLLCKKVAYLGYEPTKLVQVIWKGTKAMVLNDGSMTNEERFWQQFSLDFGEEALNHLDVFEDFYLKEFNQAIIATSPQPELVRKIVEKAHEKFENVILATNPLFPQVGTYNRLKWAGLKPEDFDLVTTYENSHYCKPNTKYYEEILSQFHLTSADCLMVGNSVEEDIIPTAKMKMKNYLVTDCLINTSGASLPEHHGSLKEFLDYLESI